MGAPSPSWSSPTRTCTGASRRHRGGRPGRSTTRKSTSAARAERWLTSPARGPWSRRPIPRPRRCRRGTRRSRCRSERASLSIAADDATRSSGQPSCAASSMAVASRPSSWRSRTSAVSYVCASRMNASRSRGPAPRARSCRPCGSRRASARTVETGRGPAAAGVLRDRDDARRSRPPGRGRPTSTPGRDARRPARGSP